LTAKINALTAFVAALLTLADPAYALYRCGNSFQDKPCAAGTTEAPVNPALRVANAPVPSGVAPTAAPAPAPISGFNAICVKAGQDAQRVVWKREGGATQERQIAELGGGGTSSDMVRIIESVYGRRGSAPDIRAAIEAECLVEKQRQADAIAALNALNQAAGNKTTAAPGATTPEAATNAVAGNLPYAVDPRAACQGLREREQSLKSRMRAGGSVATLEGYNAQQRSLDKALLSAKC
jgi:hypothetical protein